MNTQISTSEKQWLGQPIGLAYIVFTEAWERFSFYGMQALMVLYMSGYLFTPERVEQVIGFDIMRATMISIFGDLSTQGLIAQLFGLYIGLVYFAPVLGGLLGDRLIGRRIAVLWGALCMAVGHFMMAFEPLFLFAMIALITGSGLLKGNLAAQVGELYQHDDPRRDTAYSYYTVAVNVGAFIAPLVCGTLGELLGWHYGFGAAGIGMLIGTFIYLIGTPHLPQEQTTSQEKAPLSKAQWRQVWVLGLIMIACSLYWIGQTQVWNTYPLWVKYEVDRALFGWQVPVTWFQSIDTLAVLISAPLVLWWWNKQQQKQREPQAMIKISVGFALFALACGILGSADYVYSASGQAVPIIWPMIFHALCAFAYLYSSPVALSLASKAAPPSLTAMMVGAFYLSIFLGSTISGRLGQYYELWPHSTFWWVHGAIAFVGALFFLLFSGVFARILKLKSN